MMGPSAEVSATASAAPISSIWSSSPAITSTSLHPCRSAQVLVIMKYLRRPKERTRLLVCSGNQELHTRNADEEKITA